MRVWCVRVSVCVGAYVGVWCKCVSVCVRVCVWFKCVRACVSTKRGF